MLRIHNYHVLWSHFPERSSHISSSDVAVLQPHTCRNMGGLGSSPFARHYWGNHCYFLFLRVLRCFSSPRSPPSMMDDRPSACRVVPFGNLRIRGHLHLPGAYRSLSRPSSPPRAKASAMCPYLISSAFTPPSLVAENILSAVNGLHCCKPFARFACFLSLVTICQITLRGPCPAVWRITDSNR